MGEGQAILNRPKTGMPTIVISGAMARMPAPCKKAPPCSDESRSEEKRRYAVNSKQKSD